MLIYHKWIVMHRISMESGDMYKNILQRFLFNEEKSKQSNENRACWKRCQLSVKGRNREGWSNLKRDWISQQQEAVVHVLAKLHI